MEVIFQNNSSILTIFLKFQLNLKKKEIIKINTCFKVPEKKNKKQVEEGCQLPKNLYLRKQ